MRDLLYGKVASLVIVCVVPMRLGSQPPGRPPGPSPTPLTLEARADTPIYTGKQTSAIQPYIICTGPSRLLLSSKLLN